MKRGPVFSKSTLSRTNLKECIKFVLQWSLLRTTKP